MWVLNVTKGVPTEHKTAIIAVNYYLSGATFNYRHPSVVITTGLESLPMKYAYV